MSFVENWLGTIGTQTGLRQAFGALIPAPTQDTTIMVGARRGETITRPQASVGAPKKDVYFQDTPEARKRLKKMGTKIPKHIRDWYNSLPAEEK